MSPIIPELLNRLYGRSAGSTTLDRLANLLEEFRPRPSSQAPTPNPPALDQHDALLITYADQLTAPGQTPLATLSSFAQKHFQGLLSGIHLLPFYPWSSDDGFSVMDFFAVDPRYGSWADIAGLAGNFDLMFDAVFNHVSAQGAWFQAFLADDPDFRDFFVTVEGDPDLSRVIRPRALPLLTTFNTARGPRRVWTTFSADQVDLNFRNPAVLLAVLRAALFYATHGARFLRLDAIGFLWKEIGTTCLHLPQTHQVIQLIRAVLSEIAPHILLITETNVPHADNLSYFGDGTNEAQLVYNFALPPLVLHALSTGNARHLTAWAESLTLPSDQVTFFNFLASHDGIGLNPARGLLPEHALETLVARTEAAGGLVSHKHLPDGSEAPYELNINFLDALSPPSASHPVDQAVARMLVAHGIMLSLQGVPGIYFHSLVGSRGDRQGAEASGIKRRINRQKLRSDALETELSQTGSLRHQVFHGLCRLLRHRQAHPAFAPSSLQRLLHLHPAVFALLRTCRHGTDRQLCLHNVSASQVTVNLPPDVGASTLTLPPFSVRWLDA